METTSERRHNVITVRLATIVGNPWKDWRVADRVAAPHLKPGEYAARSHESGHNFTFLVDGGRR